MNNELINMYFSTDMRDTYIELSSDRIMWKFEPLDKYEDGDAVWNALNTILALEADKFKDKFGTELLYLGRTGRHVCVENNPENVQRFDALRNYVKERQERVIKLMNLTIRWFNSSRNVDICKEYSVNLDHYEKVMRNSGAPEKLIKIVMKQLWEEKYGYYPGDCTEEERQSFYSGRVLDKDKPGAYTEFKEEWERMYKECPASGFVV